MLSIHLKSFPGKCPPSNQTLPKKRDLQPKEKVWTWLMREVSRESVRDSGREERILRRRKRRRTEEGERMGGRGTRTE